jgi:hypothetical protein
MRADHALATFWEMAAKNASDHQGGQSMAHKIIAVVALASAAALTTTGYAFAGEHASSSDWNPPQVVGQPGYKEQVAKPREAAAPRPIGQDPYAAHNPNVSRGP